MTRNCDGLSNNCLSTYEIVTLIDLNGKPTFLNYENMIIWHSHSITMKCWCLLLSLIFGCTISPLNLHPGTIGTVCSCWDEPVILLSSTYWIPVQQSLLPWNSKFHNSKLPRAAQSICSLLYWCPKFVQGYHIRKYLQRYRCQERWICIS